MMHAITAALFALLALYLGGWWLGMWLGNFSGLLFVLSVVTFIYWLAERLYFRPKRMRDAAQLVKDDAARRDMLAKQGINKVDGDVSVARERLLAQPWWLDWTAGLFPVIVAVFVLRSFFFEPFKIPSGSMVPTLLVGDLILVNKYHYGVRLPVINKKIVPLNDPQRGDVMVFRYPPEPRVDYIKRVVAIPGDEVSYLNQKLSINGVPVPLTPQNEFYDEDSMRVAPQFLEKLGAVDHRILVDPKRPSFLGIDEKKFPFQENCRYSAEGVVCKVPAGHYFMMGDNRDNSQDSRYWGFVPDENIVGRAFMIWMNFGNFRRIGFFN